MDYEQHPPQHARALRRPASPLRAWVQLVKPGIVFGNLISVLGGYLFASGGHPLDPGRLLATVLGTALVVASGCVLNNCIDRDIDRRMVRTCHRALALKALPLTAAIGYSALLGIAGLAVLVVFAGPLACALGVVGWVVYVGFYSLWLKRRSPWATVVGSVSGAMPSAMGYCAVSGTLDEGVLWLMLGYCLWQMAHSHAIALFHKDDVRAAGLPALPPLQAMHQIIGYVLAFLCCGVMLGVRTELGAGYFLLLTGFGGYWLFTAVSGWNAGGDWRWGRKVFRVSITVIMAFNLGLALG